MHEDRTISDARDDLTELVNQAAYGGKTYTISRRGKALAVLVGHDQYQQMLADLHVVDDPTDTP